MRYTTKIAFVTLVTLAQVQKIVAQAAPAFEDDVQDVPVDTWIIPMALVGIALIFYFIKKKSQIASN